MPEIPASRLKAVRRIEIRTNRLVSEGMGGEYHSVFKGRGMEFSDVREYVPGDDVRSIDWNVTSRAGAPFVKRFVEEVPSRAIAREEGITTDAVDMRVYRA